MSAAFGARDAERAATICCRFARVNLGFSLSDATPDIVAAAWHSGANGVTNAFTSSFWWSDALGVLAAHNHTVYCRQTLLGGNYGLLNRTNYQPNPDFYISQLFHDLMGDSVLKISGADDGYGYLRTYAHCNRNGSGITLLLINIAPKTTFTVGVGGNVAALTPRLEYALTADALSSRTINLNGSPLVVGGSGSTLPPLVPSTVPHLIDARDATLDVGPHSIVFVVLPDAVFSICKV